MSHDQRDALEVLRAELDHIEKGGYGRSVRTPWLPTSVFQDSLTCVNFGYPYRAHPCQECLLNDYVPPGRRSETVPCHHIPMTPEGETIADLELRDNQPATEQAVKDWPRARIITARREVIAAGRNVWLAVVIFVSAAFEKSPVGVKVLFASSHRVSATVSP